MKFFIIILTLIFNFNSAFTYEFLTYLDSAYKNNPTLNAERKNYKAIKENINISRSKFLPSISISETQSSQQNSNRTNQSGSALADTNNDTTSQSVSIDQNFFKGFIHTNKLNRFT